MFQPVPTPLFLQTPYGVTNAIIPDYTFAPTPLGQGGSGSSSSSSGSNNGGGTNANGLNSGTAGTVYSSPNNFHCHLDHNNIHNSNPQHRLAARGVYPSHQTQGRHYSGSHSYSSRTIKMEPPSDLAQQEAAARDYKPELQGPLVGEVKSSHAITEEYAKANPIYVAKTIALPQTYSLYRQIQGDGNCGWRAIGFGYFENLIRCGDVKQLQDESQRLTDLNSFLEETGGYNRYIFEDMTEVTIELFGEIIQALQQGQDAMPLLTDKWNSDETSSAMIYHLRLLAASYLKGNLTQYEHFITGDANTYCDEWILPVNKEIDQIAVDLLFNIFLKPANIVLEIAYLDISPGSQVNVHRWPEEAKDKDPATLGPIIHLLYRPDHYDLLYREAVPAPPPPPSAPVSLQVNRVASFSHQHEIQSNIPSLGAFSSLDLSPLAMIPGFDGGGFSALGSPPPPMSPLDSAYSPSPQSSWLPQPFNDGLPSAPSPMSSTHSGHSQSSPQPQTQDASSLTSLRFSKHMFPVPGVAESSTYAAPDPAFQVQTNIFKQSFYNTAHYNNPHFQPEEYKPDQEEEIPIAKSNGRKRSN